MKSAECVWTYVDDDFTYAWTTGCENMFSFAEEGPEENCFKFCCYCGGQLVAKRVQGDAARAGGEGSDERPLTMSMFATKADLEAARAARQAKKEGR